MYQKILVPVDDSTASEQALQEACRLAQWSGASLYAVHVVDGLQYNFGNVEIDHADISELVQEANRATVTNSQNEMDKHGVNGRCQVINSGGDKIAAVLLREVQACGCDLIVMGTHGFSGLMHLLMGSVAEGVVREAQVPVLLVRYRSKNNDTM